jgi:hypothetical protein
VTLTLSVPANPGLIGPGAKFSVHNDLVGPIPADDYLSVILQRPVTFEIALYTVVLSGGSHDVDGVVGVWSGRPWSTFVEGNWAQLAQGDAVLVNLNWQHASGVITDTAAVPGAWAFDAVGGLGAMMAKLHQGTAGGGGTLDEVLAAVRRTYP